MSFIEKSFTSEKYTASYPVHTEHDEMRLDQFVQKCLPGLSRQFLKKKIQKGEVVISGRTPPHKSSVKVHFGERVTITTHNDGLIDEEHWYGRPVDRSENPTVIFEDKDLLVINKPPFMVTHPTGKNLFYCATIYFEELYKQTIYPIHRIDKETSGILILGKNPGITQKVTRLFEENEIRKCYFFIAHKMNPIRTFPFTARQRLDNDPNSVPEGMITAYEENSTLGKESETRFELLFETDQYVLALAFPVSGRQHQIRVHAACNGYPLLGDKLYNGDSSVFIRFKDLVATKEDHEKMQIPRHALHATGIILKYPDQNKISFIAPIPQDLTSWVEKSLQITKKEIMDLIQQRISDALF